MTDPSTDPDLARHAERLRTYLEAETRIRAALLMTGPGARKRRGQIIGQASRIVREAQADAGEDAADLAEVLTRLKAYLRGTSPTKALPTALETLVRLRRNDRARVDARATEIGTVMPPASIAVGSLTPEQRADFERRMPTVLEQYDSLDDLDAALAKGDVPCD